ncbi:MAG: hypothetical protein ACO1OB_10325 [Archangium sp.]
MLSFGPRVVVLSALGLCLVAAAWFRGKQNSGAFKGGRISNPKLLWLFFCIWFWLFECAALAFEPSLPSSFRIIFGVHALSFWLRGGVEMYLLHVTKTWRPPMGIAHDVFCILTVLGLASFLGTPSESAWGWWAPALVVMLLFSLTVETAYAALFFRAVEGKTTGEDPIWFASEEEARFKRINRITFACNVPQVAFQVALLAAALR